MPDVATGSSMKDGRPILVVDDDEAILHIVADVLRFEGYRVETALDGAQALQVVERSSPRLVLLDMRMPLLDGWGFARVLRERGIHLPILVMTAARDAAGWAAEIGAEGYLAKPFDIAELLDAVRGYAGPLAN
ncbi:MAG TPA: response regulator [Candidatus Limnocylindria bacterium]|jgi:DNA-binding response OmpR family regulator|nr:response regulator [Candidatus Limnocylindria bacterium]